MLFDQSTMFVAGGICACALAFSMLNMWASNRSDRFLATWLISLLLLGSGVFIYGVSTLEDTALLILAFLLKSAGFTAIYLTSREFAGRLTPWPMTLGLVSITAAGPVGSLLFGYTVAGWTLFNLVLSALVLACAWQYWRSRAEAPGAVNGVVTLYGLTAISFLLCAVALLLEGGTELARLPENWAENLNAVMCVVALTGVGALSIGLNQSRAAHHHHRESRTDELTGLLNRRALFGDLQKLGRDTVVVVFDLDHFKSINDQHGHATGDEVLKQFGRLVASRLLPDMVAARLGGEEFVLVMPRMTLADALGLADSLRRELARTRIKGPNGSFHVTTSVGLAVVTEANESLDSVLTRADTALYRAKGSGRNRVSVHSDAA